ADPDGGRAPSGGLACGRDLDRDDLLLARDRALGLRVDRGARLRYRPGGQPVHRRGGRGRQSRDRSPVRGRRPADQVRLMGSVTTAAVSGVDPVVVTRTRSRSPAAAAWRRLISSPVARAGLVIVCAFVLMAVVTPLVHHYEAKTDSDLSARLKPPERAHLLGTDSLGRDVLVRVLHGAWISLGLGVSSVAVASLLGSIIG